MPTPSRPPAFWVFTVFLALSIVLMLLGQTLSVFDYGLAVRMGMQESREQVSEFGVQVNRAFAAGDTVVYVPLLIASLVGLWLRKRWGLIAAAATAGVSAYWSATIGFTFLFLQGVPGYGYCPPAPILLFVGAFLVFGVWALAYLVCRGDTLIE